MKKIPSFWFTLIELMVAITIIAIIAASWSRMNFNEISDSQYLRIFSWKITWIYETTRNNMLIGRTINTSWNIATSWKIEIPTWSWKTLQTYFSTGWVYQNYSEWNYTYKWAEWIARINCYTATGTTASASTNTWTWIVIINYDSISFSWTTSCDTTTTKKLIFETFYHNHTWTLEINWLNWLTLSTY